ncbi:PREDICTED: indeterminate-domain [Prunus dulcis]|uniref:PREDICTED: indeterminate-domain n=1 Tax=Prunus dulcis TaxID=3755 RepID=A0A5E4FEM7_PRUDU|nr:protein indeterminate-domain 7 [Prunus dulcis]XP_034209891.1 protein indeterminate-domain 7 [Prunus dulcis]XP_034209892.1 protein indeterminate-domain 7 [Prunus dulcis]XP_034209893.1 protein indeterminate-domain 7 [Prunus dulcis]VVA24058.1 PREDICTED: indeterminate-domain [Prunus dulcis]
MMKGLMFQQQQQQQHSQLVDENMSNLTSASGEAASVSSGNRNEIGTSFSQQFFAPPPSQTQPALKKKRNLPGNPDPEAEVIALSPKTLMATNRFICEICNKGFQRDQNLQLHRRGHNLPWKLKQRTSKEVRKKVYVCPEASCVHHDPSRALGDLTGIKKHFCRKHGEKKWKCDKCSKRYAVQSDWKAHSKSCGTREYRCDCGTLFSRRDSFITHRAFCDALAEESARAITTGNNNPLLISPQQQQLQQPGSSSASHHHHMNLNQVQLAHQFQDLHGFSLKKEQQSFTSLRPDLPPWLACPGPPNNTSIDLSSSSSIFSPRLDQNFTQTHQDLSLHDHNSTAPNPNPNPNPSLGPTLPPFQPAPSPHMSATALLQKAAQMGATMSSKNSTASAAAATSAGSSPQPMMRSHQNNQGHVPDFGGHVSSFGNNTAAAATTGAGGASASSNNGTGPPASSSGIHQHHHHQNHNQNQNQNQHQASLLRDMMNSLSSGTGFEGASFELDAFGSMPTVLNNSKKDTNNSNNPSSAHFNRSSASDEGGGHGEGLTRDFLGLRALSHSDILNIAGLGSCVTSAATAAASSSLDQTHKPWQG